MIYVSVFFVITGISENKFYISIKSMRWLSRCDTTLYEPYDFAIVAIERNG